MQKEIDITKAWFPVYIFSSVYPSCDCTISPPTYHLPKNVDIDAKNSLSKYIVRKIGIQLLLKYTE